MKKLISTLLAACVLLSLAACGAAGTSPQADGTETYVFTDDLGREVTAPAHPERVAAMIGSFADVWCLAGGRDSLVAAADDAWTSFDLGLGADVTNLGAVKEPGLEALIASEPDLILASCNTAANLELLDTFEAAGLWPFIHRSGKHLRHLSKRQSIDRIRYHIHLGHRRQKCPYLRMVQQIFQL